jgi:glutathione S-transferase
MKLYFSPLACSMAPRIALYEVGDRAGVELVRVDTKALKTESGDDYRVVHPLGLVPALALDEGGVLSENAAILQYIADRYPEAELAPKDPLGSSHLHQWLSFIGTELHKVVFLPILDKHAPDVVKAYSFEKAPERLSWVANRIRDRSFVLDRFSVVDAYLFTVLNWAAVTPIDLQRWPEIVVYMKRMHARPSMARAFAEERALYFDETVCSPSPFLRW